MTMIIILVILCTALVLIAGLVLMAKGGYINKKYSNKIMSLRVGLQAISIIVILVIYYLKNKI